MQKVLEAMKEWEDELTRVHRKGLITNGDYVIAMTAVASVNHTLHNVIISCAMLDKLTDDSGE